MEGSKIILCIPGLWKNRSEIVESVARQSEGYIFAGNSIGKLGEPIGFLKPRFMGMMNIWRKLRLQGMVNLQKSNLIVLKPFLNCIFSWRRRIY